MVSTAAAAGGTNAEAARVHQQNERLREENIRLRAAIAAVRPETPTHQRWVLSTSNGVGAVGAADQLVQLMKDGGHLLQEREMLLLENAQLASAVENGDDAATAADIDPNLVADGQNDADEDPALLALDRLVPLLSEGDGLRAEREALRAERAELLGACEGEDLAKICETPETDVTGDQELELRFRGAIEDVTHENASLEAEVAQLREENKRLQRRTDVSPETPIKAVRGISKKSLTMDVTKPEEEEDQEARLDRQRDAMATLLQVHVTRSYRMESPIAKQAAPIKHEPLPEITQELAVRSALHTLFRSFVR